MKHYPWLDGMRGLAALCVLLHHAALEVKPGELPPWVAASTGWLEHGHMAVAVFIVLSGFSLMLPVARDGVIRGGFRGYLARRSRRILPPYYATLAIVLLLIAATPLLRTPGSGERSDFALPALEAGPIIAHLLLIHNLSESWIFKIDPPMWSIAIEWQIYFLFPVLVLCWRRFGHAAGLILCLLATYAALPLMGGYLFGISSPWFMVLFALGMMAATAATGPPVGRPSPASLIAWVAVAGLTVVLGLLSPRILRDMGIGIATAVFLARAAGSGDGLGGMARRALGSRPLVVLGTFSYSLYLIHFPLVSLASNLMQARGIAATTRLAVLIFVAAPIIVAVAYLFHLAFEKPFLVSPARAVERPSTAHAPAPA